MARETKTHPFLTQNITFHAIIVISLHDMALFTKVNDLVAFFASSRFKSGRILEFLEIVLVRAIPHVHLGFNGFLTFFAVLPPAIMSLLVM